MFAMLITLLFIGIPVVYSLGIVSVGTAIFLWGPGSIYGIVTSTISTMNNWTLIATPLFTFMSLMLLRPDLLKTCIRPFTVLRGHKRRG
jgi:TRAP-type mannitol/chloroaromatic compound transport system permease large subunit